MNNKTVITYRPDIDGLRAIAVLLVLIYHFKLVPVINSGFVGVDIFFVISGYLITSIIRHQLDNNTFDLKTFYANRIRRLAPALFTVLILVLGAGYLILFPVDFKELSQQVLYSQFYVVNIYFWRSINYFGLNSGNVFLLHNWSLAVEEQFYLVYPIILIVLHRYLKTWFWHLFFLGILLSLTLNMVFVSSKPEATFYLLPTRAWELLAGGLIPLLNPLFKRNKAIDEILGASGILLIILSATLFSEEFGFPGWFAILPVTGALLIILSGSLLQTKTVAFLSLSPVVYVGRISYSLYLVHWPINVLSELYFGDAYSFEWHIGMFVLSFLLSIAIYHSIEDPIRHRRFFKTHKSLGTGYLAGLVTTVLVFTFIQTSNGLPSRFPPEVVELANRVNDRSAPLTECEFRKNSPTTNQEYCLIGAQNTEPKWFIYGDSHAWAAHSSFNKWLKKRGEAAYFAYRNSCPPVIGLYLYNGRGVCNNFNRSVSQFIKKSSQIENVFLISTWAQAREGLLTNASNKRLALENSIVLFDAKFSSSLVFYKDAGKKVFIWEPLPGARRNVPETMAKSALSNTKFRLEYTYAEYLKRFEFFFTTLKANKDLISLSFSPSKALCTGETCAVALNGKPAYFDSGHMANSTSDFWSDALTRQFNKNVHK